jgi:hypothetical protein
MRFTDLVLLHRSPGSIDGTGDNGCLGAAGADTTEARIVTGAEFDFSRLIIGHYLSILATARRAIDGREKFVLLNIPFEND